MQRKFLKSRVNLILLGIGLGWIARFVLGAPAEELDPPRTIDRPIEAVSGDVTAVSVIDSKSGSFDSESGLVQPIRLPGTYAIFKSSSPDATADIRFSRVLFDDFSHDESASFEAHGETLCASGCAISRHPTSTLTKSKFERLLVAFAEGPMADTNQSLEELVFFGPQTRKLIESEGVGKLDSERANFLWDQLTVTHARISIRVKDDQGVVRTWIDPTRVPFDRRHVFKMQTNNVQPLVTSGTVKRVGLNHLWTRL